MRKLVGAVAIVAIVGIGACGGGSDNKSENASNSSDTTAASGSGSGNVNFTKLCEARAAFATPNPGNLSSADLKSTLKKASENLDDVKASAPSEIKADIAILVDPSKQQQMQALAAKFDEAKVKAAREHVDAYVAAHCK